MAAKKIPRIFGLDGSKPAVQINKIILEQDINVFIKDVNFWDVNDLKGENCLDNFKVMYENYVTAKPKPSIKHKRALIQGLVIVTRSLDAEVKAIAKQLKDTEIKLAQDVTIQKLKSDLTLRESKNDTLRSQRDMLSHQADDVLKRCQQLERDLTEKVAMFNDSKATVRHLLSEKRQNTPVNVDHSGCQHKIKELEQKLGLARGFFSAINEGVEKDIYITILF